MGFNWGGFAGGLSSGINTGMKLGGVINDAVKEYKVGKVREDALAEAAQMQAQEQAAKVKYNGAQGQSQIAAQGMPAAPVNTYQVDMGPSANPAAAVAARGMPPPPMEGMAGAPQAIRTPDPMVGEPAAPQVVQSAPIEAQKRFAVGAQGFDDRASADKAAAESMPKLKERQRDLVAERLEQHYIETGDIDTAEKWSKWRKSKANEVKMDTWAAGSQLAKAGDYMGAARKFIKLYGDYKDGTDVVSADPYNDEKGRPAGFNMVLKDAEGGTREVKMDARQVVALGANLNPQAMFQHEQQQMVEADKAMVKMGMDALKDGRKSRQATELATMKEDRDDRRLITRETEANKRAGMKETAAEKQIRLKEELRAKRPGANTREVGLAPHPQKIAMQIEKELKDDTTKYEVAGSSTPLTYARMNEAQRDEVLKRKVDKRMATFGTGPAGKPPGKVSPTAYKGASIYMGDEDDEDD